jgi:hypothetical protein
VRDIPALFSSVVHLSRLAEAALAGVRLRAASNRSDYRPSAGCDFLLHEALEMETGSQVFSWLKDLTDRLVPRHDAFKYLYSLRSETLGRRSARLPGTGWRGAVPRATSLRRELAALLKTLD